MKECFNWQRARSDDQIEQREIAILSAAAELFEARPYHDITFAMIGKQAQFTRSNLYRYFQTKEEVFLKLLERDLVQWRDAASEVLSDESTTASNFVDRWLPEVLKNKRLLKLNEILTSVLEMNASEEALRQFKMQMALLMESLVQQMLNKSLFKTEEGASKFLISHISLISGMSAKLNMPEQHKKIMTELGMAAADGYYESLLREAVNALYHQFNH